MYPTTEFYFGKPLKTLSKAIKQNPKLSDHIIFKLQFQLFKFINSTNTDSNQ